MSQGDRTRLRRIYPSFRQREIPVNLSGGGTTIILSGNMSGDSNAAYVVMSLTSSLSNERQIAAGTGLFLTDGGAKSNATFSINNSVVATTSGSTFSQITGSIQKTSQGLSYLVGQGSVTVISQSNGQILISGSSSGGSGGGSTVQTGANYGTFVDVLAYSLKPSINFTDFRRMAMFEFNPSSFRDAGGGTRTIKFRFIGETTGPMLTAHLFNVTSNEIVSGSILTTTSITPQFLTSSDLSANLSSGSAIYELRAKMNPGLESDIITCGFCALRIEWV